METEDGKPRASGGVVQFHRKCPRKSVNNIKTNLSSPYPSMP